jgi:acyl carrier protein
MDLINFFHLFCEELDDTDISTIDILTDFKNIDEWDSLLAFSIIACIDDEFDVLLTGSDIIASTSIEDLYNCVISKQS